MTNVTAAEFETIMQNAYRQAREITAASSHAAAQVIATTLIEEAVKGRTLDKDVEGSLAGMRRQVELKKAAMYR